MKLKNVLFLIGVLLSVLPNLAFASTITIEQDWGWIQDWNEHKYVVEDDLYVNSHISLSLSKVFYNYSNNYTFEFHPGEPDYGEEPQDYSIRVFRDCRDVSLQKFFPVYINCTEKGEELKEGIDFQDILGQKTWTSRVHEIRIFQNESFKEWVDYDILISYKLENFVQKKGSYRYFRLSRYCRNHGDISKGLSGCPQGNPIRGNVIFDDSDFRFEGEPECGKKDYFLDGKREYLWTEGVYRACEIGFIDVGETETLIPFKWALFGAVVGSLLSVFINQVFIQLKGGNNMKSELKLFLVLLIGAIGVSAFYVFKLVDPSIMDAILFFLLVMVTTILASATIGIVKESKNDRELKFINEQIGELYSPLKFRPTILQITREEYYRLMENSHLASEDMEKLLKEYFKTMDEFGKEVQTRLGKRLNLEHDTPEFVDLKKRFDEKVNSDYELLLNRRKQILRETEDN